MSPRGSEVKAQNVVNRADDNNADGKIHRAPRLSAD
jgi:hypothetical protein